MRKKLRNLPVLLLAAGMLVVAIWMPETAARYHDRALLNRIESQPLENENEGYRFTLSSNEKLYILAKSLDNRILPESDQSAMTRDGLGDMEYQDLTGAYAFVVNHEDQDDGSIAEEEVMENCNRGLDTLKGLGILPDNVRRITSEAYSMGLYSAIYVREPRNNLAVWKVSLSTSQQNADKTNRLIDLTMDADTGKIYEFYVRIEGSWEDIDPDEVIEKWSEYVGLEQPEPYEPSNPLLETATYWRKYRFDGMEDGSTIVTLGFYEGINELFLKITR